MNRVSFLIDGFNLYHSTVDLARVHNLHAKWLNIRSLCSSFLPLIGKDARVSEIYYFSAFAHHLNDPDVVKRHRLYVECLESTGVVPSMARFKPKQLTCPLYNQRAKCIPKDIGCPLRGRFTRYEEKETDIAIASRLFEILHNNKCDTVVLVTGDTDVCPAVNTCDSLFPEKWLLFAFPFRRNNRELALLLPGSFRIHAKVYTQHVFPNPVELPDGSRIYKPDSW